MILGPGGKLFPAFLVSGSGIEASALDSQHSFSQQLSFVMAESEAPQEPPKEAPKMQPATDPPAAPKNLHLHCESPLLERCL